MLDQDRALRTGLVRYVYRAALGSLCTSQEHGIVFSMDRMTRVQIVVYARRYIAVSEKPARAATINTMNFTRRYAIVSFTDDLPFSIDQDGAHLAP
jgi:hypothetical protein